MGRGGQRGGEGRRDWDTRTRRDREDSDSDMYSVDYDNIFRDATDPLPLRPNRRTARKPSSRRPGLLATPP